MKNPDSPPLPRASSPLAFPLLLVRSLAHFFGQRLYLIWVVLAMTTLAVSASWHSLHENIPQHWKGAVTAGEGNLTLRAAENAEGLQLALMGPGSRANPEVAIIQGTEGAAADLIWKGPRKAWPKQGLTLAKPRLAQRFCLLQAADTPALSRDLLVAQQHWQALEARLCLEYR